MSRWLLESPSIFLLADATAKATVVLGLTMVVARLSRRSSAAFRHRLWALALCGMAAIPPLSWMPPGWRVAILPAVATSVEDPTGPPDSIPPAVVGVSSQPGPRPDPATPSRPGSSLALDLVAALWAVGFIAAIAPAVAGVVANGRRRRRSRPVLDPAWLAMRDELAGRLAIGRRVEPRTTPDPLIPMTWGTWRPVVLLPESAQGWPTPALRLVMLHELAHVKRLDVAVQLFGRLVASAYWFHPLAWHALGRLRSECESACDDQVVSIEPRRTDYARQLVDLARSLRPSSAMAAMPITRGPTLEGRITMLFDDRTSHETLNPRLSRGLLALAALVVAGLATVHPARSQARPPAPAAPRDQARVETHPITISGRALDPAGKPIAGAKVYVASLAADYKRLAEATTDAQGRYSLKDVPLPIAKANTSSGRDYGAFQVFGEAEGFGFAYRPQKYFHPRPKPSNITHEPERRDPPFRYELGQAIALDLNFPEAARLSGTIVDDRGKPVAGARLEIRGCDSMVVRDNVIPGWSLDVLNQPADAPASMKLRLTDADGKFEFDALPADCVVRISMRANGFPDRWIYATTTELNVFIPYYGEVEILKDGLKVTMATPVDVPITVVADDTGLPMPKVLVQAGGGVVNTSQTSDDLGRSTLRVPPGDYRLSLLPERGTDYLVTEARFVVGAKPPAEPIVARLKPAAVVEVTVVDADNGEGLPNVDLWRQVDAEGRREVPYFRSWEVATRIAHVDRPRTNARGVLRILVEPGTHRLGVGFESSPRWYTAVESKGQEVETRAGETTRLKFTMRKRR